MEWFKLDSSLKDHEKVRFIMRATGWDKHKVLGVLTHFWSSVAQLREDGDLTGLQEVDIWSYAGLIPRSSLAKWRSTALELFCSAELIDKLDDGRIVVHGWWERYEPMMKDRLAAKARMSKIRADKKARSPEPTLPFAVASKQASKQANISEREPSNQDDFELFWKAYPKLKGNVRKTALDEWNKAIAAGAIPSEIIAAATRYRQHQDSPNPDNEFRAVPAHARTWLHQQRWNDWGPDKDVNIPLSHGSRKVSKLEILCRKLTPEQVAEIERPCDARDDIRVALDA